MTIDFKKCPLLINLSSLFSKIWDFISSRGVSSSHEDERPLIELYNQMALFSVLVILIISVSALFLGFPTEYVLIASGLFFFYLSIIIFNHFGKIYTVRFIVSILSPIWICTAHFLIAGNFSQGLLIVTGLTITYVSFSRRPAYRPYLIAFGIIIYLSTLAITHYYGPYLGVIDSPYDEVFALFIAGGWLGSVIFAFIKDRERLIKTLQNNNTQLKHTTEELERFTYIASHDLKSPLRTINSFIGLIERDISRENYNALPERMQFVKSGAQQMNTLVEDILEISTLKDPNDKKKEEVDLNKVLEKVQANLTEDINSKNAVINSDKLPSFYCDEAEFLLVFQNVIQNGIKYNDNERPTVNISTQKTDNHVIISFKDNGIGIDEEYHNQIFQFFKRLHSSDKYMGTGLGLGLCKKIVNSYDGKIEVDSKAGEGSTFRIKLKLGTQSN